MNFMLWLSARAVRVAPFSNRLAHAVPSYIQGLRCLCNFEALRFSGPIRMLAAKMVDRMIKSSSKSGGRYVSVHLRFEEVLFLGWRNNWCDLSFVITSCDLLESILWCRIWWHFLAAYMMEVKKKSMRWILFEKEAGEESFAEEVE